MTFEPATNNKCRAAFAAKVLPESKYIYIAGERLKLSSIKTYLVYSEEEPIEKKLTKRMRCSPWYADEQHSPEIHGRSGRYALGEEAITTFQNKTFIDSKDEIDIEGEVKR